MANQSNNTIGGQALIEGVMMKGPSKTVIACRLPDGSISTDEITWGSAAKKCKLLGYPVIRGAVALIDAMVNGYRALMLSAERSGMLDELETEGKAETAAADAVDENVAAAVETDTAVAVETDTADADVGDSVELEANGETEVEVHVAKKVAAAKAEDGKAESSDKAKKESIGEVVIGIASLVLGIGLAIVLFMWLPSTAFNLINRLEGVNITNYRALFEGLVKIVIFVAYMFGVSFMKDIRRVFMYHGAEHKSIFCYEKGLELTVENVREQKRFHPRCGTSFMILMLIVSIVISYLLTLIPAISLLAQNYSYLWVLIKLLMLPLTCGIGYELIKLCGRYDNAVTRAVSAPGVWLQHITTKEPDDSMLEVAIESIKAVIPDDCESADEAAVENAVADVVEDTVEAAVEAADEAAVEMTDGDSSL